ncbi:MAG: hypothetical protein R2941_05800 [Desulfobacterales bacterium]
MNTISIPAHYDGERILLDTPFDLKTDMQLVVMVIPKNVPKSLPDYWLMFLKSLDMFPDDFMETRDDFIPESREVMFV